MPGVRAEQDAVLSNRNAEGWDIVTAHSQFALFAENKVLIYYQSCDLKGRFKPEEGSSLPSRNWLDAKKNRMQLRNAQRLGVAVSKNPAGPFERAQKPVATPEDSKRIKNITDNPAVVYENGQYLMIMKSDDARKRQMFRIQITGHSKQPQGPFQFADKPVYAGKQTEDATLWYDKVSKTYCMVCHVMGEPVLAMFNSTDGLTRIFVLLKVAARVTVSVRRIVLHMASSYPFQDLFRQVAATLIPAPG